MSVEFTIVCDGCSVLIDASKVSAAEARRSVREDMGGRTGLPGGKDLCPQCVLDGRKPE